MMVFVDPLEAPDLVEDMDAALAALADRFRCAGVSSDSRRPISVGTGAATDAPREDLDRAGLRHSACLPSAAPNVSVNLLKRFLLLPSQLSCSIAMREVMGRLSHEIANTHLSLTTRFINPPNNPSDFAWA
jgi:hypothetical protein